MYQSSSRDYSDIYCILIIRCVVVFMGWMEHHGVSSSSSEAGCVLAPVSAQVPRISGSFDRFQLREAFRTESAANIDGNRRIYGNNGRVRASISSAAIAQHHRIRAEPVRNTQSHSPRADLREHRRHISTANTAVIADKRMFSAWMMDGVGFYCLQLRSRFGGFAC